jgi:TonB family protein
LGNWLKCNVSLAFVLLILWVGTIPSWTQQVSPSKPASVGAQAVGVVVDHYAVNPTALEPTTHQPLPSNGRWSVGKELAASCPQAQARCIEVFYEVPAQSVRCSWVLVLYEDGKDGKFLDVDDDTQKYWLLKIATSDAKDLVETRKMPVYPPIAVAARQSGPVVVGILIGMKGEIVGSKVVSGNAMLQQAALDATLRWTFKPAMVGDKSVTYQTLLVFTFRTKGFQKSTIDMEP